MIEIPCLRYLDDHHTSDVYLILLSCCRYCRYPLAFNLPGGLCTLIGGNHDVHYTFRSPACGSVLLLNIAVICVCLCGREGRVRKTLIIFNISRSKISKFKGFLSDKEMRNCFISYP